MSGKSLTKSHPIPERGHLRYGSATPMSGKSLTKSDLQSRNETICYGSATPMRGKSLTCRSDSLSSQGLRPSIAKFLTCQGRYDVGCETHHLKRRSMFVHNGSR